MEQIFDVLKKTQAQRQTQEKRFGSPNAILDAVHEWTGSGENLLKSILDYVSDIASREKNMSLVSKLIEKRAKDLEDREKDFDLFRESKMKELAAMEETLSPMVKDFSRDDELDEQLKLVQEHIKSLEADQSEVERLRLLQLEKLKKIKKREEEVDFMCRSLEKRLREIVQREKDFDSFKNGKLMEFASEEKVLSCKRNQLAKEMQSAYEKFGESETSVWAFVEMLELATNTLGSMKVNLDVRLEEIESMMTLSHSSLDKQFKELEKMEEQFHSFHEKKMQELESKEKQLSSMREEVELLRDETFKEQQLLESSAEDGEIEKKILHGRWGKLEFNERSKETCLEEVELNPNRDNLERKMNEELNQSWDLEREIDELVLQAKKVQGQQKECSTSQSNLTDEKTLENIINSAGKDFELTSDEVFKILLRSSDPAKLVLDAIEGFYRRHLGKGDLNFNVKESCIVLLDQLTIKSPKIEPCVREAAMKLASKWKSNMRITTENPLQVLGFLHFLAAYNLSSCFDKDELLSLLKMVAQHKKTPVLCRILGLSEKIHVFIQNLINEKQYLLASSYIYECKLESVFPQSGVLDYYVRHTNMVARANRKRGHNTIEAQEMAIASEIADLQVAIEHIVKYGLESDYSPHVLRVWIRQLERDRANLKHGVMALSSSDRQSSRAGGRAQHLLTKRKDHLIIEPDSFHEPCPQQDRATMSIHLTGRLGTCPTKGKKRRMLHEPRLPAKLRW